MNNFTTHRKITGPVNYITIKEFVTDKLREEILSGEIAPGEELNTKELAVRYNCSATPIREALSALESEGLVTVNRHKTGRVTKLDIKEIEEIFGIRVLLEGYASNLAFPNINEKILKKLEENIKNQEIFYAKKNYTEWFKLNRDFHKEIYKSTRQSILIETINALNNRAFHYVKAYTILLDRCELAISEHKEIFKAFLKGNKAEAKKANEKHLVNLAKSLTDYLKEKRN